MILTYFPNVFPYSGGYYALMKPYESYNIFFLSFPIGSNGITPMSSNWRCLNCLHCAKMWYTTNSYFDEKIMGSCDKPLENCGALFSCEPTLKLKTMEKNDLFRGPQSDIFLDVPVFFK